MHGFEGAYPASAGIKSAASSFALQAGGGLNLYFTKRLGVRLLEADFVRNALPNAASNIQNDLRLSFGLTCHFARR